MRNRRNGREMNCSFNGGTAAAVPVAERLEPRRLLSNVLTMGDEFQVNTYTTGSQGGSTVGMDAAGNFVVVWGSDNQDGSDSGIFAQRYNAAGVPLGAEFQVNTYTPGPEDVPVIATDAHGDFVVAWSQGTQYTQASEDGSEYGVFAQRFNAAGVPQGHEFQVNNYTTNGQLISAIAMDANGNFAIVWEGEGQGDDQGIFARRFDAAGAPKGDDFRVNVTTAGFQFTARDGVAMDAQGDFVVTWESDLSNPQNREVYARRFNAAGVGQSGDVRVNTYTTGDQFDPVVAVSAGGDYVVAWDTVNTPSHLGIFAQRFNAAGVPQGQEFKVNTYTTGGEFWPAIASDPTGNFVVSWDSSSQEGAGYGIYAQRYNAAGAAQGGEFHVNTYTPGDQQFSHVALDGNGDFVITWYTNKPQSSYDIYAQRYAVVPGVTASSFLFDTAPQKLSFTFNHDVAASLGVEDVLVQNLTTGQTIDSKNFSLSYSSSTNIASFGYTAGILPDGSYRATLMSAGITTPQGASMAADYSFDFFVLAGDANHDRNVDVTDLGFLATNWQGTGKTFSQGDFNYDGVVDVSDLGILATQWQQSLPPPATAAALSPTTAVARHHAPRYALAQDVMD
jgi:hypothetical protein